MSSWSAGHARPPLLARVSLIGHFRAHPAPLSERTLTRRGRGEASS